MQEFEQSAVLFDEEAEDWAPLSGSERARAEAAVIASSQTALANALTLIQQGVELALKGRIAAVSPWLLILRDPRDFPRNSTREDVSFSAFRTVDAADLLRIHDSVCAVRMPSDFGSFWDGLRQQRNAVIHSGRSPAAISPAPLLAMILQVNATLLDGGSWPSRRRQYHDNDFGNVYPIGAARPDDGYGLTAVVQDIDLAVRHLQPAELKAYLGFDTRKRAYICPQCNDLLDSEQFKDHPDGFPRLAQLTKRSPDCATVWCVACEQTSEVGREPCADSECRSNVLSAESDTRGQCLLCGWYQDEIMRRLKREASLEPPTC